MSVSFFVVDPLYTDGADLLLSPDAFPEPKPDAKPLVVIWRLVATYDNRAPQGLYLPIDKTMVVDALSVLFPQLSTSSSTGPSLERIESCLARQETFTLLLATEITPHVHLPTGEASTPRVTIKIAKIVGCLTLITLQLLMKSRAHIEDLVVLDEYRGQGIGRGLMQRALNEAVEVRDCTMVDLTSRPDRAQARALYESLGFTLRETGVFRYTKPTVG
ncbi:MAG: acyl-CoA N-acyltransferase [Benniella sp.]|nr:MAG: acyl-CoA N-acyltransferase [Benniella sp.]